MAGANVNVRCRGEISDFVSKSGKFECEVGSERLGGGGVGQVSPSQQASQVSVSLGLYLSLSPFSFPVVF